MKRFVGFMKCIFKTDKTKLKILSQIAMNDVRSIAGSNVRNILLLTGKLNLDEVAKSDIDNINLVGVGEGWRVGLLKEIVGALNGDAEIEGFSREELEEIQNHLCTS